MKTLSSCCCVLLLSWWCWCCSHDSSVQASVEEEDEAKVTPGMPNILYVISDDLSAEFSGPNMNSLKRDGISFSAAFTNYPVCGPSRASFLTGLYPDIIESYKFTDYVNDEMTIPKYLGILGYSTASFGKVFHGPYNKTIDVYKDHWTAYSAQGSAMEYSTTGNLECPGSFVFCNIPENISADYNISMGVVDYLANRVNKTQPWFVAVGFRRPHLNLAVDEKFVDPGKMTLEDSPLLTTTDSLNYFECDDLRNTVMNFTAGGVQPIVNATYGRPDSLNFTRGYPEEVREIRRYYKAAVTHMDAQLGRILSYLKTTGQYKSTVVIFHGDHGWNCGRYGMWCKNTLFDGAVRVPFTIKAPAFKPNTVFKSPVQLVDLFPTILALIKAPPPPEPLSGKSLVGLRESENLLAFSQYPRCLDRGLLQDNPCTSGAGNQCLTLPSAKYMGYSVRKRVGGDMYTLIIWKPFTQARPECGDPHLTSVVDWDAVSVDGVLLKNKEIVRNKGMRANLEREIWKEFRDYTK